MSIQSDGADSDRPGNRDEAAAAPCSFLNLERGVLYRWLSLAFQDPAQARETSLRDATLQAACRAAAETIRWATGDDTGSRARGEAPLACLSMNPSLGLLPGDNRSLVEQYDRLFGLLLSRDVPPYETEYCPQTFSVHRSHQLADIAGFYKAFGLEPSPSHPERADHIALELEFMSWLILKQERAHDCGQDGRVNAQICREAQQRFLTDHLLWWAPALAFAIRKKADHVGAESDLDGPPKSFYGATAQLLAAFTRAERLLFGLPPSQKLISPNPTNEDAESMSCESCGVRAQ